MKKAIYKKIDERVEYITIHHDETIDELGNIIPAYDEVIEKVIPIMGTVYEEMTQDEILSLENEVSDKSEPTLEERLYDIEAQMIMNSLDIDFLMMSMKEDKE